MRERETEKKREIEESRETEKGPRCGNCDGNAFRRRTMTASNLSAGSNLDGKGKQGSRYKREIVSKGSGTSVFSGCLPLGSSEAWPKRIGQAEYLSGVLYVRSPRWNSGPGGKRVVKVSVQLARIHYGPLFHREKENGTAEGKRKF